MTHCDITWMPAMTYEKWDGLLKKCPRATLLQSFPYALAMRACKQQGTRHGLVTIDGTEAGIVQMHEVSLFNRLIHGLSIDRGPLWFEGYGKEKHIQAFATRLDREFPLRLFRKRRFMPEFSEKKRNLYLNSWKINNNIPKYKTIIVDLSGNIDEIRMNLRQKWRNTLNKSEKSRISIVFDENLDSFGVLLRRYLKDRLEKRYAGASAKFLTSLVQYSAMYNDCLLLNATEDNEIVASVLILVHGAGATYQVGWISPYGRNLGAHHLLLWHAIKILKMRGVTYFDLGGYNDKTPGITQFKEGLGGQNIALIGCYG